MAHELRYEKGTITSVRGVLIDRNDRVFQARRLATCKSNPWLWEIIGGKLKQEELEAASGTLGRANLETALRREVPEEIGLEVTRVGGFSIVERRVMHDISPVAVFICYAALIDVAPGDINLNPHEHDDSRWVDTTRPLTHDMTVSTINAIGKFNRFALGL